MSLLSYAFPIYMSQHDMPIHDITADCYSDLRFWSFQAMFSSQAQDEEPLSV